MEGQPFAEEFREYCRIYYKPKSGDFPIVRKPAEDPATATSGRKRPPPAKPKLFQPSVLVGKSPVRRRARSLAVASAHATAAGLMHSFRGQGVGCLARSLAAFAPHRKQLSAGRSCTSSTWCRA